MAKNRVGIIEIFEYTSLKPI